MRFGIAESLRLGQNVGEISSFGFHPREDVIASAVDDAVEAGDAVADQSFAQDFDDRNAAGNARFVIKIGAGILRGLEQLFAVRGEQRFIGRDDRFAELQCVQHQLARRGGAAYQFHDECNLRVVDDARPVRGQERGRNFDRTPLVDIAHGHFGDMQPDSEAGRNQRAIPLNGLKHASANSAAADDAQIDLLHKEPEDCRDSF